jgi:hypothetical protein
MVFRNWSSHICGCYSGLDPDEYILPMHRNLGVFTGEYPVVPLILIAREKLMVLLREDRSFTGVKNTK